MTDLEKAQEVLRAWRRDADRFSSVDMEYRFYGEDDDPEFEVSLDWGDSVQVTSPNPLTAALEATKQTPWPQSVGER